jgi:iron complex transport system substrate-binding protein
MRIVSLSPSSTEILFALGAGDDVIGVTQNCDYPANALHKEHLGSWLQVQPTAINALKPDLIITTSFLPEELRTYTGSGEVLHLEPSSLGSVLETILIVGRTIGRTQIAEKLVCTMQKQFENIRNSAPAHQSLVYCEMWPSPPTQAGLWVPEIVEIAGGKPLGGLNTNPCEPTMVDALSAADPDLMVFHWCNQDEIFNVERILERPGWANVRALQTNAYTYFPNNLLNRPGPRLVDGARQLQAFFKLHSGTKRVVGSEQSC